MPLRNSLFPRPRRYAILALLALLPAALLAAAFRNPYAAVDWETVGHYDACLHSHTHLSDGEMAPHEVIDAYHRLGYAILALTDHDSHHDAARPAALYPWTALDAIFDELKDQNRGAGRNNEPWGARGVPWEGRDPEALGMTAIQGSEISRTHHIGSYFNDYAGGTRSEEEALREIGRRDGLAVFFHPGRYRHGIDWYVDFYRRHPHLVGVEVYNQRDRYPRDRELWDRLLHRLMPERPVWGFANDDMHRERRDMGRNRNVMLLPVRTAASVRSAMEQGHVLFFVPVQQGGRPSVRITGVEAGAGRIALELAGEVDEVQWITHCPETDCSIVVARGPAVTLNELPRSAVFVRAVVVAGAGRLYTQPFGIDREAE